MFGRRRKEEERLRQLGHGYFDSYTTEADRGLAALGRRPTADDIFTCHRTAVTVAASYVMRQWPEVPEELLVTVEEKALQNLISTTGTTDVEPVIQRMIESAVDAVESGDMNKTTPLALSMAGQMAAKMDEIDRAMGPGPESW